MFCTFLHVVSPNNHNMKQPQVSNIIFHDSDTTYILSNFLQLCSRSALVQRPDYMLQRHNYMTEYQDRSSNGPGDMPYCWWHYFHPQISPLLSCPAQGRPCLWCRTVWIPSREFVSSCHRGSISVGSPAVDALPQLGEYLEQLDLVHRRHCGTESLPPQMSARKNDQLLMLSYSNSMYTI